MRKSFIALFAVMGAIAAGVIFGYSQGMDFSDMVELAKSYGRKVTTLVSGASAEISGDDPMAIATALVAGFEGFSPKVYEDAGKQAIGYGHDIVNGDGFDSSSTIGEADAFALLQSDLSSFAAQVDSALTVDLSANQRAALYSFAYNVGIGAFKSSTLLKDINAGDLDAAAEEFSKWNHSQGAVLDALTSRRSQEAELFSS